MYTCKALPDLMQKLCRGVPPVAVSLSAVSTWCCAARFERALHCLLKETCTGDPCQVGSPEVVLCYDIGRLPNRPWLMLQALHRLCIQKNGLGQILIIILYIRTLLPSHKHSSPRGDIPCITLDSLSPQSNISLRGDKRGK